MRGYNIHVNVKKTVCFDNSTCRLYSVIVQLKVHAVLKLPVGDSN